MIIVTGTYRTGTYKFKSLCDTKFYQLAFLQFCLVFPFFVCVCVCNFFVSSFLNLHIFMVKKKASPLEKCPQKCSPLKLSLIKENKLPTKHNLLKIAIINLQQQKLHKNYHLLAIPITVPLLSSPRLSSHHAFDSLISWLYFKNVVKEK